MRLELGVDAPRERASRDRADLVALVQLVGCQVAVEAVLLLVGELVQPRDLGDVEEAGFGPVAVASHGRVVVVLVRGVVPEVVGVVEVHRRLVEGAALERLRPQVLVEVVGSVICLLYLGIGTKFVIGCPVVRAGQMTLKPVSSG